MAFARDFFLPILREHYLLRGMVRREIANQHVGSVLGLLWTVIHPLTMIFIYWMVFEVGFRARPANNVPFAVWLTAGLAAWNFFAETVSGSARVVTQNATLIKKTIFPSQILPLVRAAAALTTHGVMLAILLVLMAVHALPPSWYWLQCLYYFAAFALLTLGLGWLVAAFDVFLKDTSLVTTVVLQILFWATPIMWDLSIMPEPLRPYFKLNPLHYIVQGYRDSFFNATPFWAHPLETCYFWAVALTVFVLGGLIFHRLKPHFADVL